ncbi:MAG: hypothetical protein U1E49_20785 [Hyphomicrobiaceae bacterium]
MAHVGTTRIEPRLPGLSREARVSPHNAAKAVRQRSKRARGHGLPLLIVILFGCLVAGWSLRGHHLVDPERGIGYAIGITAGLMLLTVLLYPLRKRAGWLGWTGRVARWFQLHMTLGLIAPTLALLHSNFALGALNSRIALYSLLTVAASGLVGRYLYARLHRGLYGTRTDIVRLLAEAQQLRRDLSLDLEQSVPVWDELGRLETQAMALPRYTLARMWHAARLHGRGRRLERRLLRECHAALARSPHGRGLSRRLLSEQKRELAAQLRTYFDTIDRFTSLGVFERLFGLWHVLHVPLFVVLIVAVIGHIVAVHLY